jgi:ubiquinone/menaquinone biosynthesis C-methylase UbiE
MGVDTLEQMIDWSRLRAREAKVEDKVEFWVANVLDLPFDADRFDVVFCESVLAFVEDKTRAIQECVHVTRPGGYVGLNETYWIKEPSPEMVAQGALPSVRRSRPLSSGGRCGRNRSYRTGW